MKVTLVPFLVLLGVPTALAFDIDYIDDIPSDHFDLHGKNKQLQKSAQCNIITEGTCKDKVKFYYYSRFHPNEPIRIHMKNNKTNLGETYFEPHLPTKIILHGYNGFLELNVMQEIKNQYLKWKDLNVFLVDWSYLAAGPCYPAAVLNTQFTGKCLAKLIKTIHSQGTTDIHLVGFSLGAHISAYAANNIKSFRIPRITGLDPALPGFSTLSPKQRLDPTDAEFVDVLHTNAFVQGKVEQCGHVDFYINGGISQPGCETEQRHFACSHHRAPIYFAESITSDNGFWGWPCPSYFAYLIGLCPPTSTQDLMGQHARKSLRGVYVVITKSFEPYALGKLTNRVLNGILRDQSSVQTESLALELI